MHSRGEAIAICCRTTVQPLDVEIAKAVLRVGQFTPRRGTDETMWERQLTEEGTTVVASFEGNSLALSISPSISTDLQHAGKRHAAGAYFEIAAKYAEKIGGEIVQHSNIGSCKGPNGEAEHHLASYPSTPLQFDQVCPGFQALFISEG